MVSQDAMKRRTSGDIMLNEFPDEDSESMSEYDESDKNM